MISHDQALQFCSGCHWIWVSSQRLWDAIQTIRVPAQSCQFSGLFSPHLKLLTGMKSTTRSIILIGLVQFLGLFLIARSSLLGQTAAHCRPDTIYLDSGGNATAIPDSVNNNSTGTALTFSLNIPNFNCTAANIPQQVVLTASGTSGTDTCHAIITVLDTLAPSAICSTSATISLDAFGNGTITAQSIDNGSNDACGLTLSILGSSNFNCANVGSNTIVLLASDPSANTSTCSSLVNVVDQTLPNVFCTNDTFFFQDSLQNLTLTIDSVASSYTDNCGIASTSLSASTFTIAQAGTQSIVVTVTDVNGNTSTCTGTPTLSICKLRYGYGNGCPFSPFFIHTPTYHSIKLHWDVKVSYLSGPFGVPGCSLVWVDNHYDQRLCSSSGGGDCVTVYDTCECPIMVYDPILTGRCFTKPRRLSTTSCSDSCTVSCFGDSGMIALEVLGVPPFSYLWSTGSTNDTLGPVPADSSYSVTVTDSLGHTVVQTYYLAEPPPILISLSGIAPLCGFDSTGSVTSTILGGCPPYDYLWNTVPSDTTSTISGLPSGIYSVTITDQNGCSESTSYQLSSQFYADFSYLQSGPTFQFFNASNFGTQWAWSFGDGGTSSAEDTLYSYSTPGTYLVCLTVTDSATSCSDSSCQSVTTMVSRDDPNNHHLQLSIHPNPTTERFTLVHDGPVLENVTVRIVSSYGEQMWMRTFERLQTETPITATQLLPGLYIVQIITKDNLQDAFRLLIK